MINQISGKVMMEILYRIGRMSQLDEIRLDAETKDFKELCESYILDELNELVEYIEEYTHESND